MYLWLSYTSVLVGAYLLVVAGQLLNLVFQVKWTNTDHLLETLPIFIGIFWLILFILECCRVPQSDGSGEVIVNGRIVSLEM